MDDLSFSNIYKMMQDDHASELSTLRAEVERLREALVLIEKKSRLNKVNPDLIWGIAKEALK